ncbi:MAG: hypothetical protein K2I75_06235 [Clostridiales bacterium]|nr:hypothetical protein [Clostridiales bacterium]
MDKKTVRIVVSVILGIAAFVIVATAISMLFSAILAEDPITIAEPIKDIENTIFYIKHSYVALFCIAVPTVVCYFLTYFSKSKKVFGLISVLLSLLLIAMCLGFIFDLRSTVLDLKEAVSSCYTLATASFEDMFKLLIPCIFTCAYFTAVTVSAFRADKTTAPTVPTAPTAQPEYAEQTTVAAPEQGE